MKEVSLLHVPLCGEGVILAQLSSASKTVSPPVTGHHRTAPRDKVKGPQTQAQETRSRVQTQMLNRRSFLAWRSPFTGGTANAMGELGTDCPPRAVTRSTVPGPRPSLGTQFMPLCPPVRDPGVEPWLPVTSPSPGRPAGPSHTQTVTALAPATLHPVTLQAAHPASPRQLSPGPSFPPNLPATEPSKSEVLD